MKITLPRMSVLLALLVLSNAALGGEERVVPNTDNRPNDTPPQTNDVVYQEGAAQGRPYLPLKREFQNLVVVDDEILLTSVLVESGKPILGLERLVGLRADGTKLWERPLYPSIGMGGQDEDSYLIQNGTTLRRLRPADGTFTTAATLPPHALLGGVPWLPTKQLALLGDDRPDLPSIRMLDPKSFAVLWQANDIESAVAGVGDTVVAVSARRSYRRDRKHYTRSEATLVGLDRQSGVMRWSVPLQDGQADVASAARVGTLLVVADGSRLICLDPRSGEILARRDAPTSDGSDGHTVLGVTADGSEVAYLDRGHFKHARPHSRTVLHFASLPGLQETRALTLNAEGIRRFALKGDVVVTAGSHGTACFDLNSGQLKWRNGKVAEWTRLGDSLLAIENVDHGSRARLVGIGLQDGSVRELYSERSLELGH